MKKIMFNESYRLQTAVLERRKTNTRRVIPQSGIDKAMQYAVEYFNSTLDALTEKEALEQYYLVDKVGKLPYKVGEVVAIAQSYKDVGYDPEAPLMEADCIGGYVKTKFSPGWTNKMFVRADLMPNRIRITNVRVERLQDISDEDCIKEGIEWQHKANMFYIGYPRTWLAETPRKAYAALIDKVSGKGTWARNPYVFVYDFELVK